MVREGQEVGGTGREGVPLIPRYNAHITFPSTLTTHRPTTSLPPCRFASRTFLVLVANLIDISQFLTPSGSPASTIPFFHWILRPSSPSSSSCPAAERGRRRETWTTETNRGIFLPSNRTSESSMGQYCCSCLPAGTRSASCKYLSAYCITRHDNARRGVNPYKF